MKHDVDTARCDEHAVAVDAPVGGRRAPTLPEEVFGVRNPSLVDPQVTLLHDALGRDELRIVELDEHRLFRLGYGRPSLRSRGLI